MTDSVKKIFARNLTRYIDQSGKTQKELADMLGVAQSTFNNWCTGVRYPRMDKVEQLAQYFGIKKSDLIEENTLEEKPAINDGLTEHQRKLIDFAERLSDDQAEKVLRLMQSILAFDE